MKLTNFFAMLFAVATLSFAATSCSKDDKDDKEDINSGAQISQSESGVSELKDNGSELSYSFWETAAGVKITTTFVYGYNKATGEVTSMKIIYESNNSKYLDILYDELKANNPGYTINKSGNKITAITDSSSYEGLTIDLIKFTYQEFKNALK